MRAIAHLCIDAALVALALYLAFWTRFDGAPPFRYESLFEDILPWVVAGKLAVLAASGAYAKVWRYVSMRDLGQLLRAVAIATVLMIATFYFWDPPFVHEVGRRFPTKPELPRSVFLADALFTMVFLAGVRFLVRALIERPPPGLRVTGSNARNVLIVGAGETGRTICRQMEREKALGYVPIAFVDDNPNLLGGRLYGVKVKGALADLPQLLQDGYVHEVVVAIPSAPRALVQRVYELCRQAGKPVKTVPAFSAIFDDEISARRLKPIQVEDVLGREPVKVDLRQTAAYVTGETVLVTGAGGSIGSELVRQLARAGAERIVMVDHAEDNLFTIDHEMATERGYRGGIAVVADAKNAARMDAIFAEYRPTSVFHAAAYKHVPLMQDNAVEAVRNNVLSTAVLADACVAHDVERFVLISTDKAVAPTTVMGKSKALAERIVEAYASEAGRHTCRFMAVRFGNVLGSSGSVLPIFRRQIERGGPVTVTDRRMTRFFMTIPEAAILVVQAGALGRGGEIFLLDMGDQVNIWKLAHDMVEMSGQRPGIDVKIVETGIRPGEKLHEELVDLEAGEHRAPTSHPKIMRITRPLAEPATVRAGIAELRDLSGAEPEEEINARLGVLIATQLAPAAP